MNNLNLNPMTIELTTQSEYNICISQYFKRELANMVNTNSQELVEIIASILLGTKETRFGPLPLPEHVVVIRDVIRQSIERNVPIPMLVPFGGIKANKSGELDVAELSAIKRLVALSETVKKFHAPGIRANVRIEDINALWLYGEESRMSILSYSENLSKLITMVASGHEITPVQEFTMMTEDDYFSTSETYAVPLFQYILESDTSEDDLGKGRTFEVLQKLGWNGTIPYEQRNFYVQRYTSLYPGISRAQALKYLANYLAGSIARYKLDAKGNPTDLKFKGMNFIQLNYSQPVPGAPTNMFNNTIYYRTLPMSEARSHMPAWRAKGYLKINEAGDVKAKITNFHDKEILDQLTPTTVIIKEQGLSVPVRADYILE